MSYAQLLMIALLTSQTIAAAAIAGERTSLREPAAVVSGQKYSGQDGSKAATPLDRVAIAVDGAESSHGEDRGMWRPDPSGPQGPMQVSEAAATDVGGGGEDRRGADLPAVRAGAGTADGGVGDATVSVGRRISGAGRGSG